MTRTAREISHASAAGSPGGRAVVRLLENAGGRIGLIRRARGYEEEVARGADVWAVMCRRYGMDLEVLGGRLDAIPREGPLVVIADLRPFQVASHLHDALRLGLLIPEFQACVGTPARLVVGAPIHVVAEREGEQRVPSSAVPAAGKATEALGPSR